MLPFSILNQSLGPHAVQDNKTEDAKCVIPDRSLPLFLHVFLILFNRLRLQGLFKILFSKTMFPLLPVLKIWTYIALDIRRWIYFDFISLTWLWLHKLQWPRFPPTGSISHSLDNAKESLKGNITFNDNLLLGLIKTLSRKDALAKKGDFINPNSRL